MSRARHLTQGLAAIVPLALLCSAVVACQTPSSDPDSSGPSQDPTSSSQEKAHDGKLPTDRDTHADAETHASAATEKKTVAGSEKIGAGEDRKPGADDTSPAEKDPGDGAAGASLVAKRFVIAGGVEEREPLPVDTLQVNDTVTAFVELVNESDQQGSIEIVFEHESGEKVGFISLPVPASSPRHRTWGRTRRIQKPGNWTAVVTGENGKELARQSFSVAEAS